MIKFPFMTSQDSSNQKAGAREALPECATIAIGTVPHTEPAEAVDFMLKYNPVCPSWPQLPRADFREEMYVQYLEGMPAAVVDTQNRRAYFDVEHAPEQMAEFYEHFLAEDVGYCAITADYARGFGVMLDRMPLPGARFIKGQVTGPASFGLTVTDSGNKPVLYHPDLFEATVKALACKGRWQVERFREAAPDLTPIVFYDEPYLTQVGSALISLPPEQVVATLNECFSAINGLTGIHVCGGTDWGLVASTEVDIMHFDAAHHSREFFLYEKELAAFMERGGWIGWGILPTNEQAFDRKTAELTEEVLSGAERIAGFCPAGIDAEYVLRRSFISQSCGTGTLSPELAERCFSGALEVSDALQNQIC